MEGMAPETLGLKPVQMRRLRKGSWVAVADGAEPLVMDEDTAMLLSRPKRAENREPLPSELVGALSDAGFLATDADPGSTPTPPPTSRLWSALRVGLWTWFLVSSGVAAALLVLDGFPTGVDLLPEEVPAVFAVGFALTAAMVTAVPHELAHVLFGRTFQRPRGGVRVRARRAFATTTLTHTWCWPLSARLAAVCAGLGVDLLLLVAALAHRTLTGHWAATVLVAILVIRIVWQLRFHRNCDGRHVLTMFVDDPLLDSDTRRLLRSGGWGDMDLRHRVWSVALAVGVIAEVALVVVWPVPMFLIMVGVW